MDFFHSKINMSWIQFVECHMKIKMFNYEVNGMTLKYRPIISKLNPMGTSVSNQINLLWISRFGTLKVFDWKPKSVNNASKGYEFILNLPVNLLFCYFPYIFIPGLHHSSRGKKTLFVQIRHPLYPRIICDRFDAFGPVVLQKKLLELFEKNWSPLSKN